MLLAITASLYSSKATYPSQRARQCRLRPLANVYASSNDGASIVRRRTCGATRRCSTAPLPLRTRGRVGLLFHVDDLSWVQLQLAEPAVQLDVEQAGPANVGQVARRRDAL